MVRRLIWWQKAKRSPPFPATTKAVVGLSGISTPFEMLSQIIRQIIYALLTRAPLNWGASPSTPFDLHVLGTPPAFVLSQDQTLQLYTESLISKKLKFTTGKTHNHLQKQHCYSVFKDQADKCGDRRGVITKSVLRVNKKFHSTLFFFDNRKRQIPQSQGTHKIQIMRATVNHFLI